MATHRPRLPGARLFPPACLTFMLATAWAAPAMAEQGAAVATAEAAATPLTLAAAWAKALAANPGLQAAQSGAAAAQGAVLQSRALPNPEIAYSQEDTRAQNRTRTVQVNQLVELGGKRDARIRVAESGQAEAQAAAAEAQASLRFQLVTGFNELLLAQQRVELARQIHELAARAHDAAQKRVAAGKVPPLDASRAQVAQASARLELEQARSSVLVARQHLAALWGGLADEVGEAAGGFTRTEAPPSTEQIDARLDQAPALLRARHALGQSRAAAELERARRLQDPTLSLGVKRAEELGRNQVVFGFSIPLPLFDRNAGNQLQALRKAEQAEWTLQDQRLQLRTQALAARQQLISSSQQADQLQSQVIPTAQSAYDVAVRGFTLGKVGFIDALDAQRTLFESQRQWLDQLMASHKARAEIDRLLGTLPHTNEN